MRFPKPEKRAKPRRRVRRSKPRKERASSLGALKRKLDLLFSRYVKDRDFGEPCITCHRPVETGNENCGHFVSRRRWSLRYDPKNSHLQHGQPCNGVLRGMPQEYALSIVDKYGQEELRRLMARKKINKQWTKPELERLISAIERSGAEFELTYYEDNL